MRVEEERELIERFRNGDSDAVETLYNTYERMICDIIHSTARTLGLQLSPDAFDDVYGEARVAFFEAIKAYDTAHSAKAKFGTFLYKRVEWCVGRVLKRMLREKTSIDASVSAEDAHCRVEEDMMRERERRRELVEKIREALDALPFAQRRIIQMRFGFEELHPIFEGNREECSLEDIARFLGLSTQQVRALYEKAMKTLRNRLSDDYPSRSVRKRNALLNELREIWNNLVSGNEDDI